MLKRSLASVLLAAIVLVLALPAQAGAEESVAVTEEVTALSAENLLDLANAIASAHGVERTSMLDLDPCLSVEGNGVCIGPATTTPSITVGGQYLIYPPVEVCYLLGCAGPDNPLVVSIPPTTTPTTSAPDVYLLILGQRWGLFDLFEGMKALVDLIVQDPYWWAYTTFCSGIPNPAQVVCDI